MPPNDNGEMKKSDLRTSPLQHVISRWPGQVPDRKSLEANLILRRVESWSAPRPEPLVTQMVPTAQAAVRNLGLDNRTEGEWITFLQNIVFPNVNEVQVRHAVLQKMMGDRMDPALRSILWARVQALLQHVSRGSEIFEKAAKGPIGIGKRGGKIYGYDKHGKPIYAPQLVLELKPRTDKEQPPKPKAPVHTPSGPYRYGMTYRPPGLGAIPKGEFQHEAHPDFRHGVITYQRALTPEEIKSYELTPLLSGKEISTRVDKAVEALLSEYPDEVKELADEDPRHFAAMARTALTDQGPGHLPDIDQLVESVRQGVLGSGKEEPKALPKTIKVKVHGNLYSQGLPDEHHEYHVVATKGDQVQLSPHKGGTFGPWMPKASVRHFVNDLAGRVDVKPNSPNPLVNAVAQGKGKFLGKGDDGLAFQVGDQVVKVSTTVPYQPDNPGHRTPEAAIEMLRGQAELGNKLADMGIAGVQRSKFVVHEDKGFQIKPWVEIPKKFTREQLDAIQDTVIAIHKAGYSINNSIQAGLDSAGKPVMFDVGKAAPIERREGLYNDIDTDMDNMRTLYEESGESFVRRDVDEAEQLWQRVTGDIIPKALKRGNWKFAQHWLDRAAKKKREQLKATLEGKDLEDELGIFEDFTLADAQFDIDRAREKAGEETKKSMVLVLDLQKAFTFDDAFDVLEKAAGHKYLRRWRGPDGKWRYEYKALATSTLKKYSVGDKVAVKHKGQEGHFEVLKVREKDGKRELYVKHDETGKERWVSEVVLAELFRQTHDVAAQARNALHNISAELMGYDPMQGPGGERKPKPTKYWQQQLEKRRERLERLFDPYKEYHSIINFGARQELTGWYREELKDTVEQVKPIIANLNAEVDAAREQGAPSDELWAIRSRYIKETREPFKKLLGRINGLVNTLNYAARQDIPILPEYQKHEDPEILKLMKHAAATAETLERPAQQMQEAMQNIFSGKKDPEKWAKNAKGKITRYFNVLDETFYANTALTKAQKEWEAEKHEGRKITDKIAGRDATFLIHGKHAQSKEQIAKAVDSVEKSFEKVKRAGFGRALRDLTVHMDWTPPAKRERVETPGYGQISPAGLYHTAGKWRPDKMKGQISIFAPGFRDGLPSSTMTHELGHRFYYRNLTDGQRREWEEEIAKRSHTPTKEETNAVWEKVKAKYVKGDEVKVELDLGELLEDLEKNHGRVGKSVAINMRGLFGGYKRQTLKTTTGLLKDHFDELANQGTIDPFVSWYGGSNASEYFAEAFKYYVQGGPRNVPQWTRSLLEKLTAGQRMQKSLLVLEPPQSLMHVVVDLLEKAQRGGKYIRRVPYTDKHGKTKYRYFYKESAAARAAQTGEEIKLGQKVAQVIAVQKNGDVTIAWNGNKQTFAADAWHHELTKHYGEAYQKSAEKRARQTINAVLRHVPKHLLEDLKGETDSQRLEELKTRVPEVYSKLQRAFQRAGMDPFAAKRVITRTLERRGWEAEARAAAVGTVLTHRGTSITQLIDVSENLAGGDKVEAKHVAAASELGAAGKGEPLNEIKNLAAQAERDVAKLASMLQGLQEGKGTAAELFAEAMASKALQKLNLLSQAFPGLADRAKQPARQIVNEVAAETPRKPTREGADTVVYVAGEGGKPKALKARYRLVEASELIASHKPDTFAPREDYPAGVQERAYHRDKSEQAKVIRNAQRMDPRFVVNTNPDAVNGPPMVTAEGVVLGGNSRAMSMQRIYSHHPDKAAEMRQYLEDHAHEVGFKPEDIGAMKNPVLIREVEVPDQSKRNLQVLVRQMNESFTQGMDPRTMQVAMGRRIDVDTLKTLANDLGEDETLSSFLKSKRSERFVQALHRAGIIDDRNANQYTVKGTKTLNEDGVQLVSRILVGRTVQDADVLSDTGSQMIEAVARAIPAMTQATAHGEGYDLGPDLSVALSAFNDLNRKVAQGVIRNLDPKMPAKDFKDLFNHFRTLPGIAEPHPVLQNERATMLLELLVRRRGPVMMAKFAREYAAEAAKHPEGQAVMFGKAKSPIEVLADVVHRSMGKAPSGPGQGELLVASFVIVPEGDDILNKSYVVVNGKIRRLVG